MRKSKMVVRVDEDAFGNLQPQDVADRLASDLADYTLKAAVEVRLIVRPMKYMGGLHHGTKEYTSKIPTRR